MAKVLQADELEKQDLSFAHFDDPVKPDTKVDLGIGHVVDEDYGFTPEQQKKIIRRIDRRLVVTVGVMYCVNFMDRTNMSVANIAGMSTDLQLTGNRYVRLY